MNQAMNIKEYHECGRSCGCHFNNLEDMCLLLGFYIWSVTVDFGWYTEKYSR
jgi:hypothetical protein